MSDGFSNPLVGGGGGLVYPSIHSPDFVHGVSGWSIDKDGSAEFQDVIIPAGSGGAVITFASIAPASPHVGDIWYNTSAGLEVSQWSGSAWVAYQFGTGAIANNAITSSLIAAAAITSSLIANGAVGTAALAAGAVTTSQIAAAAGILGSQIAGGTITGSNIAAATITAGLLAAGIIVAGIVDGTTITGASIVADGTSGELLVYSGTPATGNLIASASGTSGTDGHSNAFVGHLASYGTAFTFTQLFSALAGGTVALGSQNATSKITTDAFMYLRDALANSTAPALALASPIANAGGANLALITIFGLSQDGTKPSQILITAGSSYLPAPSTSALLEVEGEVAVTTGGASITGGLTADTATVTGALTATGGTASSPTLIETDTTHGLGALGVANLTISTANYVLCPDGRVFISIVGIATGAVAGGTATFPNALAVGYRPATEKLLPAMYGGTITAGEQRPRLQVNTNGQVTLAFPTLANGNLVSAGGYMDLQ